MVFGFQVQNEYLGSLRRIVNKGEIDTDTSCQIEKQILTDEIQDLEFLNFAVENISELFGYIATGRVNIRRYKEDGPPNNPSGK